MIEVCLPNHDRHRLPFYLAVEEWVAQNLPATEYVFAWRVNPTVICGRNQDISLEVNLEYCRLHGIDVVRRRSGGGCVYADLNNYMFSYVAPGANVDTNFARYTRMIAKMLASLGLNARVSGRNDVLVGEAKIAGNAFYRLPDRSIVHGTMLYEIDTERMSKAITPSKSKLESKAVKSVSQRVTCLKNEGITLSVEQFGRYAIDFFTNGEKLVIDKLAISEIEEIEQSYYSTDFINGRNKRLSGRVIRRTKRFDGCGEFRAEISLSQSDCIDGVHLSGDYFSVGDVASDIEQILTGCPYNTADIEQRLVATSPQKTIPGLTSEMLTELMI